MIEARRPAKQLQTHTELRAGPLCTIEPSPRPSLAANAPSSFNRHATSLSVPLRP
jgi:hypothetical protein